MKKIIASLIFIVFVHSAHAQDEFELVESVPAETILEQSAVSRTSDVWLKMINESSKTLDIEMFYFAAKDGESLDTIISAIKHASARGVEVRIIIDSSFYYNNKEKSIDRLEGIQNISIRKIPMGSIAGGVMHAKYFIADDINVYCGSANMDWRALTHIHEIGARIKNEAIAETFKQVFNYDWNLCSGKTENKFELNASSSLRKAVINSKDFGEIILYPAFSPQKDTALGLSSEETELLNIISGCRDSLSIQIYSYSPKSKDENQYTDIDNALRNAALRGVKIKIIFPDWAVRETAIEFIKNLSTIENIQIKFSSIPQYSGGFIPYSRVEHCKYFVADNNISWISTSNWEKGYFYNSRNATLVIENNGIASELSKIFWRDWEGPYTEFVDINKTYQPVKRN